MNTIGIIPARMNSSRFPGKPLEKIHGMPMIGHCYHRTRLARGIDKTYVATCDVEIYDYVNSIGGDVIMTSSNHTRATTRTAEALEKIEKSITDNIDVVVMVQGDEPLISPTTISETVLSFQDSSIHISNIMSHIKTKESFEDKNNVKVVVDMKNNALYFSREPIPSNWSEESNLIRYMQTGIIAFRRDALIYFNSLPETYLEKLESIDMNRILETGGKIHMILTEKDSIGVDVPEELIIAENLLKGDEVMKQYINL